MKRTSAGTKRRTTSLSDAAWLLQIYQMTDALAQAAVADTLSGTPAITAVDARTCERGAFLVVELNDPAQALLVYELVVMGDPHAELIHSTSNPDEYRSFAPQPDC